jgi:hypothetical protein
MNRIKFHTCIAHHQLPVHSSKYILSPLEFQCRSGAHFICCAKRTSPTISCKTCRLFHFQNSIAGGAHAGASVPGQTYALFHSPPFVGIDSTRLLKSPLKPQVQSMMHTFQLPLFSFCRLKEVLGTTASSLNPIVADCRKVQMS